MILLIDNYDSFTYNLVQRLGEIDPSLDVRTVRNDELTVEEIRQMRPDRILLSPGPCTPNEAGVCVEVIEKLHREFPILGVCLGHQSIGQAFGGKIVRAPNSCTAKPIVFPTTEKECSPSYPTHSSRPDTTPWSSSPKAYRPACRFPLGCKTPKAIELSWGCAIGSSLSKAGSSTPKVF